MEVLESYLALFAPAIRLLSTKSNTSAASHRSFMLPDWNQ
jgi:hypothetical protein